MEKGRKLSRRIEFQGLDISIETDKGETRHWFDPHNKEQGTTVMVYPYGYFKKTTSLGDEEQIDVYVGPDNTEETVYIINQMSAPDFDKFDEIKVMIGFSTPKEAKQAYLEHYNDKRFFGSMHELSIEQFKNEFVKKSLPNNGQFGQVNQPPKFTYDLDQLANVEHWLNSVSSLKEKDIIGLLAEVWGPGYSLIKLSKNHAIAELRGFLIDQREMLLSQPNVIESTTDPVAVPHEE